MPESAHKNRKATEEEAGGPQTGAGRAATSEQAACCAGFLESRLSHSRAVKSLLAASHKLISLIHLLRKKRAGIKWTATN